MDTVETIILTTIVNIIITGLVGGIVIYRIQKKIDASIQESLFEHQTKFSRSYPKILEVLETFHQKYLNFKGISFQFSYEAGSSLRKLTDAEIIIRENELYSALSECQSYLENNRIYLPAESVIELKDISEKAWDLLELLIAARFFPDMSEENLARFVRNASKYEGLRLKIKFPQRKRNVHIEYIHQIRVELDKLSEQLEKHYKLVAETEH